MNMKSSETTERNDGLGGSRLDPMSPDPDPRADSIESPCIPGSLREIDKHNKLNGTNSTQEKNNKKLSQCASS